MTPKQHNRISADVGQDIVKQVMKAGGGPPETLIVLESVFAAVFSVAVNPTYDGRALEAMFGSIARRVAAIRAGGGGRSGPRPDGPLDTRS